ncbi:MAG: bifunctional diaminohydroxyphosphoribosylaminopyrimidine deaminase/5-amino-6-(5-phosphoribosylamino)uracil reductase RibD [Gemmatimonadales bacterium]
MGTESVDDSRMMAEALDLARRAAGRTSPNPLVGAVVVADGQVIGRGFHARAGDAHAEILALREAGGAARGATVYVTLEPCHHQGKTGPCTEALIGAGIRRVVVAMPDPDSQVNHRGLARLREAGLRVELGLLRGEAERVNEFYLKHRRTGLPFVALKWAMSLDGKIGARRGSATAITGPAARRYAHELRNRYDAVLVGVGTVLADNPELTCRLPADSVPPPRNPLRIIVDSRLRTPLDARVAQIATASTLIAATAGAPKHRIEALRRAGVEVLVQAADSDRVDLSALMAELGRRGLLSVLVEGGGTINAAILGAGLADKVIALIAPRLIGGTPPAAPTPLDGAVSPEVGAALRLHDVTVSQLGDDLAVEGDLTRNESHV